LDLGSGSNFNTTAGSWQAGNYLRTAGSVIFVDQAAGSTLNITGVQLEKVPTGATTGTDFEFLPDAIPLWLCQRYLEFLGFTPCSLTGMAYVITHYYKATKRVSPTLQVVSGSLGVGGGIDVGVSNLTSLRQTTIPTSGQSDVIVMSDARL